MGNLINGKNSLKVQKTVFNIKKNGRPTKKKKNYKVVGLEKT